MRVPRHDDPVRRSARPRLERLLCTLSGRGPRQSRAAGTNRDCRSGIELLEKRVVLAGSGLDFGDAPAPYPTTLADDGPRHTTMGPTLGVARDDEMDGVESIGADGDDVADTPDDEDGVTALALLIGDSNASVDVEVQNAPSGAMLDAWIDFDGDGSWGGGLEQIARSMPVNQGTNSVVFQIPAGAVAGTSYARFRVSTAGGLSPVGLASTGEVEDHEVELVSAVPGSNLFTDKLLVGFTDSAQSVFAADIDEDGDNDLVAGGFSIRELDWYRNNGDTTFTENELLASNAYSGRHSVADIDGDGDFDIIHAGDDLLLFENDGSESFSMFTISPNRSKDVAAVDIDGDGDLDLITGRNGSVDVYRNDGPQTFVLSSAHSLVGDSVTAADLDRDGDIDFASTRSFNDVFSWFENNGSGVFSEHAIPGSLNDPRDVTADDIDSDGDIDLILGTFFSSDVYVYSNDGSGTFTRTRIDSNAGNVRGLSAADVNGDGHRDIIAATGFGVRVYVNDASQGFTRVTVGGGSWGEAVPTDIDGDGDLDIAASSSSFDNVYWFENLNAGITIAESNGSTDVSELATTDTFTVVLDHAPSSNVVIDVSIDDVGEATVDVSSLTFTSGNWNVPQTVTVTGVDDAVVDGAQMSTVTLSVNTASSNDLYDTLPDSTVSVTTADDDVGLLTLTIADALISENGGSTTAVVSRNSDTTNPLTVTLLSSDTDEADVVASTTIVAGQTTSPSFTITGVDESVPDGIQTVTVTATAAGHNDGADTVGVVDDDFAALFVLIDGDNVSEDGGTTTATIIRTTDATNPLTVSLTSSDTDEATIDAVAVIAAGRLDSDPITITGVQDSVVDGNKVVTITAGAAAHADGTDTVEVIDTSPATLTLSIDDASIAEQAGETMATVTRNTDTTNALIVSLSSDDTGEATVPGSVTIAAGETTSPPFLISGVDDSIADGLQIVTVSASAGGHTDGIDVVDVTDDEVATLSVDVSALSISEAAGTAATTVTITRNTDPTDAMVVTLTSSDTSEAAIQAIRTISAGQSSVTVNLNAVNDSIIDGTRTVTITGAEITPTGSPLADSSFGDSGSTITTLLNNVTPRYLDVAVLPNGRVLAAGRHESIDNAWRVVRLNPDGSFDKSFGSGGSVVTEFPGETSVFPEGIVLQADGRITILGHGDSDWLLSRYTSDGVLDTSFSGDGRAVFDVSGSSRAYKGIANGDGSLYVVGELFNSTGVILGRVSNDGTLDPTFGTGGVVTPSLEANANERPRDIAVQPDGKLVIAGKADYSFGQDRPFVARFHPDGAVDTTFGNGGIGTISVISTDVDVRSLALQADGGIVVAGEANPTSFGSDNDWFVARFTSEGIADPTFSSDGFDLLDFSSNDDTARDVVIQDDQRIVVVGSTFFSGNGNDRALARYNPDGTLDNTFSSDGKHKLPAFSPTEFEEIWSAALQPDGRLVTYSGWVNDYRIERWVLPNVTAISGSDTVDVTDDETDLADFGDAPLPYRTTIADSGAYHLLGGPTLGLQRDSDSDGVPSTQALGDDNAGQDDEDGVSIVSLMIGDANASLVVDVQNAPSGAKLDAWIDFNGDRSWAGPYDQIARNHSVSQGSNTITFPVPAWAKAGKTYARFRLSTAGALTPSGPANDGEVEDYEIELTSATGDRAFHASQVVGPFVTGQTAFVADLNKDGISDVIAGEFINRLAWFENNGNATFVAQDIVATGSFANDEFVVDIDGDGDLDVLHSGNNLLQVYENDGSQNFTAQLLSTRPTEAIFPADVDADGDLDIVAAHNTLVSYWRNDGSLSFSEVILGSLGGSSVDAADIDNDGDIDIAVVTGGFSGVEAGWYENDGSGSFSPRIITLSVGNLSHVRVADLDVDGDEDLVVGGGTSVRWFENDGEENFTIRDIGLNFASVRHVEVADLDGDGAPEVIASGNGSVFGVTVFYNNGDKTFQMTDIEGGSFSQSAIGDVDGDGDLDIVSASTGVAEVMWFENLLVANNDYGDAPDANQSGFAASYPVTVAENGARHAFTGPTLGPTLDTETDGSHSANADEDDTTASPDEDGVLFGAIVPGAMAGINIHLQNASTAKIDAWIDFDQNGVWDASEKILDAAVVVQGLQTLNYSVPAASGTGVTYARVRVSSVGGLDPTGAATDGEVEDYAVTIGPSAGITSAEVNDSQSTRSEITSIAVQFDSIVEAVPSDFVLENTTTGQFVTGVAVARDDSSGSTLAKITFTGGASVVPSAHPGVLPSLAEGVYELSYRPATLDGTSSPITIDSFYRKYGDTNANDIVDLLDFAAFRQAFGKSYDSQDPNNGFDSGLDADRDGSIGLLDFAAFRGGFGN